MKRSFFMYDRHAASLWWKSTRGVVADEPQGLHRDAGEKKRQRNRSLTNRNHSRNGET